MDTQGVIGHITGWLKDYAERNGQRGFVVGVSGGIDSAFLAVTAAHCSNAGHCARRAGQHTAKHDLLASTPMRRRFTWPWPTRARACA